MNERGDDNRDEQMTEWEFELCRDICGLETGKLRQQWQGVFTASETCTIEQHPAFGFHWYRTFGTLRNNQPVVVLGRANSRSAIYPLELTQRGWRELKARILVPIGGEFNLDFQEPLVSGPKWSRSECHGFWRDLRMFLIRSMPDSDRVIIYRLREEMSDGVCGARAADVSPYVDLDGKQNLDQVLAACPKSHRGDVKRQMRRLAKEGDLSMHVFRPGERDAACDELRRFYDAYEQEWGRRGISMFSSALARGFLEGLLDDLLPTGWLHFSVLKCAGYPIHWHFGYLWRDRLYWTKTAYDPQWANFSPGKVHVAMLLDWCLQSGVRYFDFLYGQEPYKFLWAPKVAPLYRLEWWNGRRPLLQFCEEVLRPAYRLTKRSIRGAAVAGIAPSSD
jgi:CelD/BcsL family acetyltransferase involved in cellulose biosynthesis